MAHSTAMIYESVDVIVIGAGLSGLQAALNVQASGLSCIILEARNRVGGKTLSQPLASGKGVVDLGAAWLNEVTQPKIYALAKKYGYETVVQPSKGDGFVEDTSGIIQRVAQDHLPDVSLFSGTISESLTDFVLQLPPATLHAIGKITATLETEAAKLDLRNLPISEFDKLTVSEFLKKNGANEDAYQYFETTIKGLLGVDATELSLLFYLDYIKRGGSLKELMSEKSGGAQYQRLRQGKNPSIPIQSVGSNCLGRNAINLQRNGRGSSTGITLPRQPSLSHPARTLFGLHSHDSERETVSSQKGHNFDPNAALQGHNVLPGTAESQNDFGQLNHTWILCQDYSNL
jgi:Flavin containing amine oxidoreductase